MNTVMIFFQNELSGLNDLESETNSIIKYNIYVLGAKHLNIGNSDSLEPSIELTHIEELQVDEAAEGFWDVVDLVLLEIDGRQLDESPERVGNIPEPVAVLEVRPLQFIDNAAEMEGLQTLEFADRVRH